VLLTRIRRAFSVAQLLGEVSKPEANSAVLFTAALGRYRELEFIAVAGKGRKDRLITRGPAYELLPSLVSRLDP
jgi:hypothetical protein